MKVLLAFSDSFSSLILYQSPLYTCEEMSLKKADNILVLLIKQFFKKKLFIVGWAGSSRCSVFSLVVASGGHSLVAVHGLLIVAVFFVVEHGLWGAWAQ